jgi:hypothetical protein
MKLVQGSVEKYMKNTFEVEIRDPDQDIPVEDGKGW